MGRLIRFVTLAALAAVSVVGTVGAKSEQAPRRYKAELDPPTWRGRPFGQGELPGWYLYVYVGDRRVVCANPVVWNGPMVVTCDKVVAIDSGERPATDATSSGPWAGGKQ